VQQMRAVVQRVKSASVTVDAEVISQISKGLMVLVGIGTDDTKADVQTLCNKILSLRVFDDPANPGPGSMWKKSVKDIGGEILCVSQFTLMANTVKGNKPDFHRAMPAESGRQMYASFLECLAGMYEAAKIKDGRFGAMMDVSLTNDGPVTFTLDSRKFEYLPIDGQQQGRSSKGPKAAGSTDGVLQDT